MLTKSFQLALLYSATELKAVKYHNDNRLAIRVKANCLYVCNHVFYLALHQINKLQTDSMCGFIHVPLVSGSTILFGKHTFTLHGLVVAIECCLEILQVMNT
jgi:pyrrolidone-carboxylate peptidase